MIFEHEACAIVLAVAAAAVESYQVAAGVVVFGVAADGGSFFVDNGGLAEFGFALKRLDGLDLLHSPAVAIVCKGGAIWFPLSRPQSRL